MSESKKGIGQWIKFYNEERLHEILDYKTPNEEYLENLKEALNIKLVA